MPSYSSLKSFEGKGNYAIKKYYQLPYRFFYRKKLKMIVELMPKNYLYHNILDYGSGPGVFTRELMCHALFVNNYEKSDVLDTRWKYEAVVCASVLEFVKLESTLITLNKILKPGGHLYIASPMDTKLTRTYFKLIGDKHKRNSHAKILSEVSKQFKLEDYRSWANLYFALRASRH